MKTDVTYTWQLPVVMARAGYRTSTDLIEPLADRGIMLSRSQIYRSRATPSASRSSCSPRSATSSTSA